MVDSCVGVYNTKYDLPLTKKSTEIIKIKAKNLLDEFDDNYLKLEIDEIHK